MTVKWINEEPHRYEKVQELLSVWRVDSSMTPAVVLSLEMAGQGGIYSLDRPIANMYLATFSECPKLLKEIYRDVRRREQLAGSQLDENVFPFEWWRGVASSMRSPQERFYFLVLLASMLDDDKYISNTSWDDIDRQWTLLCRDIERDGQSLKWKPEAEAYKKNPALELGPQQTK